MEAQRLLRRVAWPSGAVPAMAMTARTLQTMAAPRICTGASVVSAACRPLAPPRRSEPLFSLTSASSASATPAARRYKSSANRTKRALNIAPHSSFLPGATAAAAAGSTPGAGAATALGTVGGATTTLLYNPPASAPSVYQTPFKFLPKTDPRRRSNLTTLFASSAASASTAASSASSASSSPELRPRLAVPDQQKYHLSEADVAELRRLRAEDPIEWSVLRLARHFRCSPIFVMMVVRSSPAHQAAVRARVDAARARWGPIRTKARQERVKRREMLYRGEL